MRASSSSSEIASARISCSDRLLKLRMRGPRGRARCLDTFSGGWGRVSTAAGVAAVDCQHEATLLGGRAATGIGAFGARRFVLQRRADRGVAVAMARVFTRPPGTADRLYSAEPDRPAASVSRELSGGGGETDAGRDATATDGRRSHRPRRVAFAAGGDR